MEMTANGNNPIYQQPFMQPMQTPLQQQRNPYAMQPQTIPQQITYPGNVCEFVQGEIGATILQLYPNQKAYLFDMDNEEIVYKKSRDANGKMSPISKYRLVPIEDKPKEEIDMSNYVKSEEILDLISDAVESAVSKELDKRLSQISFKPASKEDK